MISINGGGNVSMEEIKTNYHNSLLTLSEDFDKIIRLFRQQIAEGKDKKNWFIQLLIAPIKDLHKILNVMAMLVTLGLISAVSYVATEYINNVYILIALGIVLFLIIYFAVLKIKYYPEMLDVNNPKKFNLAAYKKNRPAEYALFNQVIDHDFTFRGLHSFVDIMFKDQDKEFQEVDSLRNTFEAEIKLYRKKYDEAKEVIEAFKENYVTLEGKLKEKEDINATLIQFLGNINVLLYRLNNNLLSFSDLSFLTGFTIYEQPKNCLIKISDHGTTGASPREIILSDEKYKDYAVVLQAKDKQNNPTFQEVRNNYTIASYRMDINNKIWFFNFHVNIKSNPTAWNLLLNDVIMNPEEVYRLFHSICLILDKEKIGAEGIKDAKS